MQTLISVRRRGWFGQIASLPLSFFLIFGFFAKATGRTVRPIWTNEGSKTRRSAQGSAFRGSEQCAPKFRG